jgi:uncharacterized membrane protein
MGATSAELRSHRTRPRRPQGRRIISWSRLLIALGVGVVAGLLAAIGGVPEFSVLVGWSTAAGIVLAWVWWVSWPQGYEVTKRLAEEEGGSLATDTAVLIAAVASLGAVVEGLVWSSQQDVVSIAAVVLGLVVVVLSWALVNTVFALKYARLYYSGGDGGIDFQQDDPPAYSDFAYLAFTVGMSFAPPEIPLTDRAIRKVSLGHALLSYLFGTVVFAVAINLVANLG